ncbi:hypothetical protein Tco_1505562 [Tanacetum coccineum]
MRCDSKTCFGSALENSYDTFFDLMSSLSSSYQYQSELARQKEIFQEYAHYTYQSLKETILAYLNTIDKMIDERACHEEELRIIEKDVKNKQEKLEMEKQETMIQKSEYSSPGDNSDAKREKQEKKENCSKTFQELKMVVLVINPRQLFAKESEFAFEVLFGEDYDSFAYKFYHNLARLENQLSRVENHEGDSKTYLIELRKQCEAFLTNGNPKSLELSMFSYYMEVFQKYTLYDIKSTKNRLVSCLNAIEKEIDARARHEDKLARVNDSRVNERTTQRQEGRVYMVKDKCDDGLVVKARRGTESEMKDACSNSGNDTQAEGPDIRLSNDTKPLHEVQSTVAYNEDANDRQHAEQPKFINEGKVDQDAEQCLENKTTRVHKENLRATLSEFSVNHICGKEDSSPSSTNELEKESGENTCDNAKSEFQTKFIELEKVLTQQTKDFDDVKLELSNRTAKFEAYFEKLEKTKAVLERQLARKVDDSKAEKDQFLKEINHLRTQLENLKGKSVQTKFDKHSILGKPPADKLLINSQISKSWFTPKVDVQKSLSKPVTTQSLPKNEKDQLLKRIAYLESKLASQDIRSCQKEYHELRTSYNALKVKFDSLNRQKWNINVSKSSKPKESVSDTGESSKPFSRRVSQFITYFLQKYRKFSKKYQSFETFSPHKGFKTRASNRK